MDDNEMQNNDKITFESLMFKINDYSKEKYKPSSGINKYFTFIIPAITGFLGAYGIMIESILSIFSLMIKENTTLQLLIKKLYFNFIYCIEIVSGLKTYFSNIIDDTNYDIISQNFIQLKSKVSSSFNRLNSVLVDLFQDDLEKKYKEYSDVD
jgi:hypothetical protein